MKTSVLLMFFCCIGCLTMDLQPYGPLMCEQLANTSTCSKTTIFHDHNLTCVVNYSQKDTVRQMTSADWKHIASTSTRKESNHGKFGRRCGSRQECGYEKGDCLRGRCACVIGYSYNFTEGRCVEYCTIYGEDFSPYRKSGVIGCNVKKLKFPFVKSCIAACTKDATCINVEYLKGPGNCNLCNKGWASLKEKKREFGTTTYTMYYRHCWRNKPPI